MVQSLLTTDPGMVHDLPILLVDDEAEVLKALRRTVEHEGWTAVCAEGPDEALAAIEHQEFAVVVSDYRMPKMDGVQLLVHVRARWPQTERLLLTAFADESALERGINEAGISRFMRKPWKREVLVTILGQALEQSRIRREHAILLERVRNRNEELVYLNERLQSQVEASDRAILGFRRRWDVALNAISDAIIVVSADLRVEGANEASASLATLPVDELEGQRCHQVLFGVSEPCHGCPVETGTGRISVRRGRKQRLFDARAYRLPGAALSHLCIYRDITREVEFELEAAQMEKLAAVGRLASGIAHEINNPLHGILSFVQLAQKAPVAPDKLARYHEVIYECAIRCRDIVQTLKSFARQPQLSEERLMDVCELVKNALVLFHHREVELREVLPPNLPRVMGNANQLQQVIVNLVQNAIDASPKKGIIEVAVAAEGDELVMSVEDQGKGVPLELRERIFEPFFTTKPEGVGTGLGLAISLTIVRDHHGTLRVGDAALGGARFEARLPVRRDASA